MFMFCETRTPLDFFPLKRDKRDNRDTWDTRVKRRVLVTPWCGVISKMLRWTGWVAYKTTRKTQMTLVTRRVKQGLVRKTWRVDGLQNDPENTNDPTTPLLTRRAL